MPRPTTIGPMVSGRRGPMRAANWPITGEPKAIRIGSGSNARPACDRRIADRLDQHIRDQQHRRAERPVEQEGHQVEAEEAAAGEDGERHHRLGAAMLLDREESAEQDESGGDAGAGERHRARREDDQRVSPKVAPPRPAVASRAPG